MIAERRRFARTGDQNDSIAPAPSHAAPDKIDVPSAHIVIPITPAERAAVEAMLRRCTLSPRLRERSEMVKAAGLGSDWDTIAAWSGRTPRTVRHWLTRFATGGIAALDDAPRSGRPPTADVTYHAALDDLADRDPRALGLPVDAWTSARLSAYLAAMTGVRIAPSWLRTLLIRHRFRCGRPKHTLDHLRDSDAVAIGEAAIAAAEKKVASEPERDELHYQDETHVETNLYLAKQWHRIGRQRRIASVGVNRRVTVFGGTESRTRGRSFSSSTTLPVTRVRRARGHWRNARRGCI